MGMPAAAAMPGRRAVASTMYASTPSTAADSTTQPLTIRCVKRSKSDPMLSSCVNRYDCCRVTSTPDDRITGRKRTVLITPRPRNGRFRREAQIRLNTRTSGTSETSFTTAAAR